MACALRLLAQHAVGVSFFTMARWICCGSCATAETTQGFGRQLMAFIHQLLEQFGGFDVHGRGHGLQAMDTKRASLGLGGPRQSHASRRESGRIPAPTTGPAPPRGRRWLGVVMVPTERALRPNPWLSACSCDMQHQRQRFGCALFAPGSSASVPAVNGGFEFGQAFVQTRFGDAGGVR